MFPRLSGPFRALPGFAQDSAIRLPEGRPGIAGFCRKVSGRAAAVLLVVPPIAAASRQAACRKCPAIPCVSRRCLGILPKNEPAKLGDKMVPSPDIILKS
jgi:hypothetical protein